MKHLPCLLTVSAVLVLPSAHAAIMQTFDFNALGLAVPDGNPVGLGNLQSVTTSITSIEDISVTLDLSGDFNGDLYAYLQHDTGFAVLLNRIGRTAVAPFGSAGSGITIALNDHDGSHPDVHLADSGSPLVGTFGSDARAVDPDLVTDTSARTADLTAFTGLDATGDWTLFVADLSSGGSHTLNSWSMTISGVPEPGAASLLVIGTALLARRRRS